MDDEQMERLLLERSRRGDTQAFGELVTLHRQRIYGVVFQIVRDPDDALDLVQDTFIKAWRSLASFDGRHKFTTWLHRISTNAAIDLCRKKQRRPQDEWDDQHFSPDAASHTRPSSPRMPGVSIDEDEIRRRIDAAMARLNPVQRATLILREVEGFSYEEIAEQTGVSTGTVMSRLFHARRNMQNELKDFYGSL